jgi:hypothetical protein
MTSRIAPQPGREGFALVATLLIILVLTVIAVGASWLASSEGKVTTAESVHTRALFSADSGGEAAINFIRLADDPPPIIDFADLTVRTQGATAIDAGQRYQYGCRFVRKRPKAGWGTDYLDYEYAVNAAGTTGAQGNSAVQVVAARLYREGY